MSEGRLNSIESALDRQGEKIDRLVEGFAALTHQNERISRLAEQQDKQDDRIHKLEQFQAQQQARRELWQWVTTRVLPVALTVGVAVLAGIKLYVLKS